MIAEFRAAFQELIDASVAADPRYFAPAVHKVYQMASQVPMEEREQALKVLGPIFAGGYLTPGVAADLSVVAGALVEIGTRPGDTGAEVLRITRTTGQSAAVFLHAWKETGGGTPPEPEQVTDAEEERVARTLGDNAPGATMAWWTARRYGLAAKTMLSDGGVRAAVRSDPELGAELVAIANQLSGALTEFGEVRALLRMAEATSAVVLDRASGRGFRVLFEGIGDNFQLHTLLADALVGGQGRGLAGERPDPRWTASFVDSDPDPAAGVVHGWWNMVTADGSWVWNEGVPADIPMVEGERVLVLEEQPYERTWNAGRVHPQVRGWLDVDEELTPAEAATWWQRVSPSEAAAPLHSPHEAQQPPPQLPDWEVAEEATAPPDELAAMEARAASWPEDRPAAPHAEPPTEHAVPQYAPQWAPEPEDAPAPPPAPWSGPADPPAWPEAPAEPAAPYAPEGPTEEGAPRRTPPGAGLLPPLPEGVSDSAAWGPAWRDY
ncbi:hypothetical protein CLV63_104133 [Murinocardiopsis flavida]|uniref:Uncharacterized protein n=1 Tax=Murinocardiopsis flavida TaxID=645275 RepID=A0A2P8DNY7_9ACTN|nr:hypothetical protein [Murinocardiopsis flavida]PSK98909.1 hypothetical protein CLV63_104133 [Murinocardiopsis flavida]